MTATTTTTPAQSTAPSSSSSNQKKQPPTKPEKTVQTDFSIRNPHWSYIHLEHMQSSSTSSSISKINQEEGELDPVTAQLHLSAALSALHGLHGLAIPIDLLHITGQQVWLRTPADDRSAVLAAVGGWMSKSGDRWRIKGWSHWSASALGRDAGQDLFDAA